MGRGKKFNDCVKRDICGAMQGDSMAGQFGEGRDWVYFHFVGNRFGSTVCVSS